ncbi:MAG: TRAP transporter substrate-binding protein [Alphaproteobacteria bacterium]|nr:TRAP transporter substrate-binding protein [Alphaproteobacteria bacterium]
MRIACALVIAVALGWGQSAVAKTYELKLAFFVPAGHFMSKYLAGWAKDLEQKSKGELVFKVFPGAQMGPTPRHYDMARTGVADVTWFLTGATPGRFPLTELIDLPYLVGSAEIGTKVLNDPAVRKYLDPEHKGVRMLYYFTHQPGQIHMRETPVSGVADLKGKRIRFASATIRDFVAALGATPVGVPPPAIAENLQKGTIDGVFIDYGGAHTAFKLGGLVKHSTEMYSYVTSFGLAMNPKTYDGLPPHLRKLIDESTTGVEATVGRMWDAADAPGKTYLIAEGGQAITLSADEDAKFKRIGAEVAESRIKALADKGLPAREVYDLMKTLSAKHAKDSFSFWK